MHPLAEAYLAIRGQIDQIADELEKIHPGGRTIDSYHGSERLKGRMKEEISLREQSCEAVRFINGDTLNAVADALSNCEHTDDELRESFLEWGLTVDQCDWCIALRPWFSVNPFAEF